MRARCILRRRSRAEPACQAPSRPGSRAGETPALAIRFGLAAIKGVGEIAVEAILKAREEAGRFQSLANMCERVDGRSVNRKVLEALIKSRRVRLPGPDARDAVCANRADPGAGGQRHRGPAARAEPRCSAPWRTALDAAGGGRSQPAGMAGARAARAREGVARLLCHGASADAVRADTGEIRAGQHRPRWRNCRPAASRASAG